MYGTEDTTLVEKGENIEDEKKLRHESNLIDGLW